MVEIRRPWLLPCHIKLVAVSFIYSVFVCFQLYRMCLVSDVTQVANDLAITGVIVKDGAATGLVKLHCYVVVNICDFKNRLLAFLD